MQLWKTRSESKTVLKVPAMVLASKDIRFYDPIRRVLYALEGVLEATTRYPEGEVLVKFDPMLITVKEIDRAIRSIGYRCTMQ